MAKRETAYLLWVLGFFSFGGFHRFYLGKPVSGLIYLCTFGLFGVGHIIDAFLIPRMVDEKNLHDRLLTSTHSTPFPSEKPLEVRLLQVCRDRNGATLSDCIIETQATTTEVKATVHRLCLEGCLVVDNRPVDGAVIYRAV